MPSTTLTTILSALTSAGEASAIPNVLANLFHQTASTSGLDIKNKTITTTFYQNNQQTALLLISEGYTIIPG